ncbi:smad nuclear-interacting protein 1 isoform X3 [Pieris napi]|uniref:smad nuclear-interacting protein 1 isoform X3 n=1 Tax=Pieris napi TaxID=78633 RepID=UPI001FB9D530|nr:smad nuclear-interacting protein 1 isoform X3 [Pieris napi]
MKSKRRHHDSSEESVESDDSEKSSSSSDSESDASSESDHRQKKKRKRANSSNSDSNSEDQRRTKKRKHKKKKKKHTKKKRRSESEDNVTNDHVSLSEGEISVKKRHKHKQKHSKHAQESPESEEARHIERRMHSVVQERRADSEEQRPTRTYYQYVHQERVREQGHGSHFQEYSQRPREYDQYKKGPRMHDQRQDNDYYPKRRNEAYPRDEIRGNKYNQFAERGPRRNEQSDEREYHHRRGPPEPEPYKERPYPVKHERYIEDALPVDRNRDGHRERSSRPDKPMPPRREYVSPEERPREKRRPEIKEERQVNFRERNERRREDRSGDRNDRGKDRKTRFTDAGENKEYSWGKTEVKDEGDKPADKEKPNFGLSGKLTADVNTVNGVVVKYTEPDDAKQPKRRWRFYPFKGDKALPILYIHRQSAFLIGRDKKVCDIPLEHPSISKQHAALQYRATPFTRSDGSTGRRVRPYVIDLDSANGTFVNNKKIDGRRYVELLERDVVKFGFSQREYVLLHENSKDEGQDDDQDAPVTTDLIKREKRAKEEIVADG